MYRNSVAATLLSSIALLVWLQALREGLECLALQALPTLAPAGAAFADSMVAMAVMALLTLGFILYARAKKSAARRVSGAVTGFIRLKTGCCYPAMLAHGALDLFMI